MNEMITENNQKATGTRGSPPKIDIEALLSSFLEFLEQNHKNEGTAPRARVEAVPSDGGETVALFHPHNSIIE
jgi:hypothetical protein